MGLSRFLVRSVIDLGVTVCGQIVEFYALSSTFSSNYTACPCQWYILFGLVIWNLERVLGQRMRDSHVISDQ